MKEIKKISVFSSSKNDCLFKRPFDLWERSDWNTDVPPFFQRLNKLSDDRSFVILAATVLEYEVDRFLEAFIPESKSIVDQNTNFNRKIVLIKAFRLVPPQIVNIADLVKNIRNEFAHNLDIDSFDDAQKSKKLPKLIDQMISYWTEFERDMCYYKKGDPLRLMFKDIWRVSFEGFRMYESSIRLFRKETENEQFFLHLMELSTKLRYEREELEKKHVREIFMPWLKKKKDS